MPALSWDYDQGRYPEKYFAERPDGTQIYA
jgi:hypothetical protein